MFPGSRRGRAGGLVGAALTASLVLACRSPADATVRVPGTSPSPAAVSTVPSQGIPEPANTATLPAEPFVDLPPSAELAVEGGDPVTGDLGSFSWHNTGSDSPWLPGEPMTVGGGETLRLALGDGLAIERWTASMQAYPLSPTQTPIRSLGQGEGSPVSFSAPPRGAWSVHVSIGFAGTQGSAEYYWQITVQ